MDEKCLCDTEDFFLFFSFLFQNVKINRRVQIASAANGRHGPVSLALARRCDIISNIPYFVICQVALQSLARLPAFRRFLELPVNEEGLWPSLSCPYSCRPCPHRLAQGSRLFPEVRPRARQRWVVAKAVLLSVLSAETARPGQSVCQLGACGAGQGGAGKLTSQGSQTFPSWALGLGTALCCPTLPCVLP
ncbi:hypothetical protein HJG60_008291 [Phyllostomus discolor]|uniref:Uncharacterized protein n=1 Tax=Phyllostomus discolor TaxID=89673 RepID=A0A834DQ78_9CHIR|nr:hypothetical protein HJG60_008291 [Phyllostomus discolor]